MENETAQSNLFVASRRCNLFFTVNEGRQLRTLQIGSRRVGVFEDDVFTVAQWCEPTPLPFAPDSVLGIVAIESRMFTVLDIGNHLGVGPSPHRSQIVALRGDEQLALAVDSAEIVQHDAEETQLLDLSTLFATVMKGQERRRRNS
jgi:chemotaxis signal transduction protein